MGFAQDSQELLAKAVDSVRRRIDVLPNYTCTATISRRLCNPTNPAQIQKQCPMCDGSSFMHLFRTDRLKIDVGVSERGQMFRGRALRNSGLRA